MESGDISDDQIIASSSYSDFKAWEGRLNNTKYWAPINLNPTDSWIQVDLLRLTRVSGIITQGGTSSIRWVKMLKIQYGSSEDTLMYILKNDYPIVSIFTFLLACCILLRTLNHTCTNVPITCISQM